MDRDYTFTGDSLQARFGHTITPIQKQRAIIFGGAIGDSAAKYTITGDTFLCDFVHRKVKKLEPRGNIPSNRAAHAAISIENNYFVFGGALGGGQLADNNLYFLDANSITDKALWGLKNCRGLSPPSRYGHVMGYIKPYLIIHGGNTGAESVSEVWVNDVINNFQWKKVDVGGENPAPRVYHSASMCKTGTASGMLVIFGGRGSDGSPLSDTWGLRKHKDGRIDWMKAPYRSGSIKPTERYQHRTLFIGTLFLVIGGRNSNMGEVMNLDIYDTDTSQWHRIIKLDRFRHIAFLVESNIFIHGGFQQQNPNVPTQSIIKLDLNKLFSGDRALFKGLAFEMGRDIITHNSNYNSNPSSQLSRRSSIQSQQIKGRNSINEMQIQLPHHPKRNLNGNKQIRLCGQVFVANYNEEAEVKKINIQNLQSENKKLKEHSSSISKDNSIQLITRYFLNAIFMKSSENLQLKSPFPKDYLNIMFFALEKLIENEPTLLRIRAPVKIFGDIHGQVHQLNRLFQAFGAPTDQSSKGDIQSMNYLFLGDFVDRGATSIQTLLLLFNLKLKYPENIFLIRGSHQDELINRSMGFGDESAAKLKQNIDESTSFFQRSNRIFQRLSLAALIDQSILCVHAGIGSTLTTLSQINKLTKPIKVNHNPKTKAQKIIYDLIWSDLCRGRETNGTVSIQHDYFKTKAVHIYQRQNYKFSDRRAETFCADNQLITIIRSAQPIIEGYENNDSVVTVFSCSDYGGCGNKCSIMVVNKNQQLMPMILGPITAKDRWMEGLDRKKPTSAQDAALRSLSFTPPK